MSEKPDKLPEFPPVPLHFDRWEYRGLGWKSDGPTTFAIFEEDRDTKWLEQLCPSGTGGHVCFHYIEAVKDPMTEGAKTGSARMSDEWVADGNASHQDIMNLRDALTEALKVAGELAECVKRCVVMDKGFAANYRADAADCLASEDQRIQKRADALIERADSLDKRVEGYLQSLAALERIRNNKH